MPGRLRTSFRSGNLAEHVGLLLLKGIAAVADVPRTEDVGLDAVATLLRRASDGNCYAEDGFVVQFKSYSETSIDYHDHELSWLIGQLQPMFIGRVSLQDSRISLYPTLHINQAVLALHTEHITIESSFKMIKSHTDSLQNVAQQCLPGINALMSCAMAMPEARGNLLMIPIVALVAALRDEGVAVQPSDIFSDMFVALRDSRKSKRQGETREN